MELTGGKSIGKSIGNTEGKTSKKLGFWVTEENVGICTAEKIGADTNDVGAPELIN